MTHANRPLDPIAGNDRPWYTHYHPDVPRVIDEPTETTLGELIAGATREFGDRPAFSNFGISLSYREIDRLSDLFATYLQQDLGLVKGDRIAIQMPNVLQYPVALFAAFKAGLIVVGANPLYTVAEMRATFVDAEPKAIVVLANFAAKVAQVLPMTSIKHVIITEVADLLPPAKRIVMNLGARYLKRMVPRYKLPQAVKFREALARGASRTLDPVSLTGDDIAFLQYTGGTTGGTKAAALTHRNMVANQAQFIGLMRQALGIGPARVIAALPLYHIFSLTVNAIGFYRFGAENVLITNPRDFAGFVHTLGEVKPDALIVVSTLAGALLDQPKFAGLDLSNLKIVVAGGMALRSSVAKRWRETTGTAILEGYGLTEASPVVSVNPPHLEPRPGTIGLPLPSTDVKVIGSDGQALPPGERGELAVRGPQVMQGYWNKPEETAKVITEDGWLLTGDVATIDDDGYLRIVDRIKEIIVVSGFNVYPGELEDAAMQHPLVVEAGAIPVPDERAGEVPKLFVTRRDDSLTEAELLEFLRDRLAGYKRPKYVEFVAELPKTNVGKVLRRGLRELEANRTNSAQ